MQAEVPVASALYEPAKHAVQAEVPLINALNEPTKHAVQAAEVEAKTGSP